MAFAEAWVRKCFNCSGVDMGPDLDDGVMEVPAEHAVWSCFSCHEEKDFDRHDSYREIRLPGVSESLMLKKARRLDYDGFIEWAEEQREE